MNHLFTFILIALFSSFIFTNTDKHENTTPPEENRFEKKILSTEVSNPTELAVSTTGKVYFAERAGSVKVYDPATTRTKVVGRVPAVMVAENGLIGMALDPQFEANSWIYLLYSREHPENKDFLLQTLSRFTLRKDMLDRTSEVVMLTFPLNKYADHSAGSLGFDNKGNLFIATGDNTPFTFYAAVSNSKDNAVNDAQRSAANSKDLRGKVLRIHPNADGTFSIPHDNLFAKDTTQGRPEIYIMGCRNPYRITLHPATAHLVWGEVGPDASEDDTEKGSMGFDELNYAGQSGFFGWPYCIADKVYPQRDEQNNLFVPDAAALENRSPNNTGLQKLPPAQKPLLWYSYIANKEYPMLGFGARTIIAGPFYQYQTRASAVAFPEYYDDAFFFADWCRNWIMTAHIRNGKVEDVQPFLSSMHFDKPIDMTFGPDGALYLLEYGMGEQESKDSRLTKIIFNKGNRPPVAQIKADVVSGGLPLKVNLSSHSFDLDKEDPLSYRWLFPDGTTLATKEASHVFTKPGKYKVRLRVQDAKGASATAQLQIMAGNNIPVVNIKRPDSSSFYWNGFPYEVIVTDKEDGSTSSGGIKGSDIKTYSYYLKEGEVLAGKVVKHKSVLEGERLVMQNDCRSCHAAEKRLIGPAYRQIALRYPAGTKTDSFLVQKIIKGGKGNWGDRAMPPHPNLSFEKVATMVSYIQSLSQKKAARVPLPNQGTWKPDVKSETAGGKYVFKAAYTDKGAKGLLPATGADSFVLRSPTVYPWEFEKVRDVKKDSLVLTNVNDGGYVQLKNINLEGVKSLTWRLSEGGGGRAELRLDAPDGPLISTVTLRQSKNFGEWFQSWKEIHVPVTPVTGTHDLYFVFRNESFYYSMMNIEWIRFNNKPVNSFPKQ